MQFRNPDETSIREGHWLIAITVHQLPNWNQFTFERERNIEDTALHQGEKRVGLASMAPQDVGSFRQHCFACEQGRLK
jgi:hypothetical protein